MHTQKKKNRIDACLSDKIMRAVVYTLMFALILIILYPLIYVVSSSFSCTSSFPASSCFDKYS